MRTGGSGGSGGGRYASTFSPAVAMETYLPSLFFEAFAIIVLTAVRSMAVPLGNLPPIRVVRFRMPPYDAKLGRIQQAKWALLFFVRQLDGFATPLVRRD